MTEQLYMIRLEYSKKPLICIMKCTKEHAEAFVGRHIIDKLDYKIFGYLSNAIVWKFTPESYEFYKKLGNYTFINENGLRFEEKNLEDIKHE